ncbi:hypothetical protein SAMN06297382_2733 [Amphiplicatus metriothermophilus]|uniref:Uncharacterized protein n=1 Tax=Amphiplicatus metriothermophilus TaxID=1519374 RepID=A0A239PZN6_9PROT|nr:putative acyltransferase [Amphiplicatus metriothermophilus]SNT75426.1 hypothetical protein SAMN06297382_2733 [Amphiplicatus metriothermophilus]
MLCCALGVLIAASAALWARAKGLALLAAALVACAALALAMLAHHAFRLQTEEKARFEAFLMSALCRGSGPAPSEDGR